MASIIRKIQKARAHIREDYEVLFGKKADDKMAIEEIVNAVLVGTAEYMTRLDHFKEGLSAVPPNYKKMDLPQFIYESRKLSFPDKVEPAPSSVVADLALEQILRLATVAPAASIVEAKLEAAPLLTGLIPAPTWRNWNKNHSTKARTENPSQLGELQHIVKGSHKVRAAGFGHSWSPIVATEEDINATLITTERLKKVLSVADDIKRTKTVTVETGVSIEELEQWLIDQGIKLTIASNVVLTDLHIGAVVSPACHGAGYEWGSVADFVRAVTLINAEGHLVTYTDSEKPNEQLALPKDIVNVKILPTSEFNNYKATLGLLGVIYSVTLQLAENSVLETLDLVIDVQELLDPEALKRRVEGYNGWVEIFWVPGNSRVLMKTWKRDTEGHKPSDRKPRDSSFFGNLMYGAHQLNRLVGGTSKFEERIFMKTISHAFYAIAEEEKVYYDWYRAIHFQAGITKMRVEDTEFAFEIPNNDYTVVTTAFRQMKDVIDTSEKQGYYPVDIVCEMRFTAGSQATLAHYPDPSKKWAHIEFLGYTVHGKPSVQDKWNRLMKDITNQWIKLGGNPHWAKGWHDLDNIYDKLRATPYVQAFNVYRKKVDPTGKFLPAKLAKIFN